MFTFILRYSVSFSIFCVYFFHVSDIQYMFYNLYISTIQTIIPGTCK